MDAILPIGITRAGALVRASSKLTLPPRASVVPLTPLTSGAGRETVGR